MSAYARTVCATHCACIRMQRHRFCVRGCGGFNYQRFNTSHCVLAPPPRPSFVYGPRSRACITLVCMLCNLRRHYTHHTRTLNCGVCGVEPSAIGELAVLHSMRFHQLAPITGHPIINVFTNVPQTNAQRRNGDERRLRRRRRLVWHIAR